MIKLDVWSDVVCPWCYIGKRRVEAALARFSRRDEVEITYRSFELDPTAPKGKSTSVIERLATKYGVGNAGAERMIAQVTQVAAQDGLEYHLDRAHSEQTFDAHRLMHFAKTKGKQLEVSEGLFRAYFTEARRIGSTDELVRIAEQAGLDGAEARAVLEDSNRFADEVRADEKKAAELGIRGVPYVVANGKYGVSGAQPVEVFLQLLEHVASETPPAEVSSSGGAACGDGACEVPARGVS